MVTVRRSLPLAPLAPTSNFMIAMPMPILKRASTIDRATAGSRCGGPIVTADQALQQGWAASASITTMRSGRHSAPDPQVPMVP